MTPASDCVANFVVNGDRPQGNVLGGLRPLM